MLDVLNTLVPKLKLGDELIVQLADVDIVDLILPLQEGAGMLEGGLGGSRGLIQQ